ncbi:MAG TPA: glycosyltransferase family 4 protein [Candidatus Saccharimonadia bacterium]|nr:glycosyltransferase family 4 protein [Candidatus Saccharimonadia bacterium]
MSLRVLFYVRANHDEVKGGDLVQLESTAAGLRRQGVTVDYSSDPAADLSSYDVVHIFNSPRFGECISFLENAHRQHKPVALSTIFWGKDELAIGIANSSKMKLAKRVLGRSGSTLIWRQVKGLARFKASSNYSLERRLFAEADLLLPNSDGEMDEINRVYHVGRRPYRAVRNAIEATAFAKKPSTKREDFVLSVGRIELRKNTLQLIEACHELGLHLVLIGGVVKGEPYNEECLAKIKQYGFDYAGTMPPDQIVPYYYRARVHAIAAWYETPGLATMEAACGGCTIVSTNRGSTREYFGDLVHYCDPFSRASLVKALRAAIAADPAEALRLRDKIMRDYTWDQAATDTLAGYRQLLG